MRPTTLDQLIADVADQFAQPPAIPTAPLQCLDTGAMGMALFHATLARHDPTSTQRAHAWLRTATSAGVDASDRAGLLYGLPALALVLSILPDQYANARATVTSQLNALAHHRADTARARMGSGTLVTFGEYDTITGLTGIGAVLLRVDPHRSAMERILDYLVKLTEPVRVDGEDLPGWWVEHDPWLNTASTWKGGHANLGMAHGIGGVLALLSLAYRNGVRVCGQEEAITRICACLDAWSQQDEAGTWWPSWLTHQDLTDGSEVISSRGGRSISWCYGTPGLARAHQLAGLALGDMNRCRMAEHAMAACLEPSLIDEQGAAIGLCHGLAGLVQTAHRMAQDQQRPAHGLDLRTATGRAKERLRRSAQRTVDFPRGLLEGLPGVAMTLSAAGEGSRAPSWDTCLLLTA